MLEGYKPFKPSATKPLYENRGTFGSYPAAYTGEIYDDVGLRKAMMSDRNAPVKEMNEKHGLSDAIKERKPWKPTQTRKVKLTRNIATMRINRHNI
jgi:hypothetical protein